MSHELYTLDVHRAEQMFATPRKGEASIKFICERCQKLAPTYWDESPDDPAFLILYYGNHGGPCDGVGEAVPGVVPVQA